MSTPIADMYAAVRVVIGIPRRKRETATEVAWWRSR